MMSARGLLCVVVLMVGCGGNMRQPDPVPPEFVGTWDGGTDIIVKDDQPRHYENSMRLDANGPQAILSGICPDGMGTVVGGGFDGVFIWQGDFPCQAPSFIDGCPINITYSMIRMSMGQDGLHVDGMGHADACGEVWSVAMSFVGTERIDGECLIGPQHTSASATY